LPAEVADLLTGSPVPDMNPIFFMKDEIMAIRGKIDAGDLIGIANELSGRKLEQKIAIRQTNVRGTDLQQSPSERSG
jgi:hypothetical protein